jgi:hypothetical protein
VLDSAIFSSIIYILYVGGPLSPPLVTPRYLDELSSHIPQGGRMAKKTAKAGAKKKTAKKR